MASKFFKEEKICYKWYKFFRGQDDKVVLCVTNLKVISFILSMLKYMFTIKYVVFYILAQTSPLLLLWVKRSEPFCYTWGVEALIAK